MNDGVYDVTANELTALTERIQNLTKIQDLGALRRKKWLAIKMFSCSAVLMEAHNNRIILKGVDEMRKLQMI